MPKVKNKPGPKPGSLDKPPGVPFEKGCGSPEERKAALQQRIAAAKQKVIDAAGPLRPLPDVIPTLFEDMIRAWKVPEHPLDGPGVVELRRICKDDFAGFMKMYREEERREAARKKAEGAGEEEGDPGTEAALELIERLLADLGGESAGGAT